MANLKIDLYCNDGSPLRITRPTIYGRGVGGAELSMMTWAETMVNRGHRVRIYNDPDVAGDFDGVEYLPKNAFDPNQYRDVFITYRSPNPHTREAKAGIKIHWSTDQYTIGNYATDIVPFVDKIICISPYHQRYYEKRYNPPPDKLTYIDLGVRLQDYPDNVNKIKHRFVYCSVPERGLKIVGQIWPEIRSAIPDATLVITADHTLWGATIPNNHTYRLNMIGLDGVLFLGAIERRRLVKVQCEAQVHLFPCTYEELFCVSSAECQAAAAYSMTSTFGALETTNQYGLQFPGNPDDPQWQRDYTAAVIAAVLDQDNLTKKAEKGAKLARGRFDWDRICDEWEQVINEHPGSKKTGEAGEAESG